MKKMFIMLLTLCLVFSLCVKASADEKSLDNAPDLYDPARIEEIDRLNEKVENFFAPKNQNDVSPMIAYPIIKSKTLDVPIYQQEERFYCGPASVQMVLSYFGKDLTQDSLANTMKTNNDEGTYVYQIQNCLNSYLGAGTYKYVSTSEMSFIKGMKYSIEKNDPVICHIMTGALQIYQGRNTGHYVVVTGYLSVQKSQDGLLDEEIVYYNDPHFSNEFYGKHSCTVDEMTNGIDDNAHYYIMGK